MLPRKGRRSADPSAKIAAVSFAAIGITAMAAAPAHASSDVSAQASMYCGSGGGYRSCLSLWNSERDPVRYSSTVCNRNKSSYLINSKLVLKYAKNGGWHVSQVATIKPGKCITIGHRYTRHAKVCTAFYMSGSNFALIAVCHKW
jgi:hypothetical protein